MNITILGCGKSGIGATKLALSKGYNVRLTESKDIDKFEKEYELLKSLNVPCEFGLNSTKYLDKCDLIVSSPGISKDIKFLKEAQKRNIPIISEIEFAYRHTSSKIISVTGTNGKTTTTSLINFILNNAGLKSVACGNIGYTLSEAILENSTDCIFVVETSSYQLDLVTSFAPDIAIILNITPDHQEYHKTMHNYIEAKWKTSIFQNENNLLILNSDDDTISKSIYRTDAKIGYFSLNPVSWGIYRKDDGIYFKTTAEEEFLMFTEQLSLPGIHNLYNSMAAALAARACEVSNEDIRDSLSKFNGVEHRLELVRTIHNTKFINDSKATNINATWYALSSYSEPLIWIAGGRAKNNDYSELDVLVEKNVKVIICIGEEQNNIFNHFCSKIRCIKADNLEEALNYSVDLSEENNIVLFSPACKSFDAYLNYEQRGEHFKELVNNI
ncbi:MAG TPA: UDP-N-acetylmuramoyl-L-alanine--D-glutamate ligase [Candidatus Kapabacteria bacterium]|nr:UDP-N-acetylmuramoyl-L-alanine--D-glutamate ligase [Candidatus Kapabacteria bacterium]